MRERSAEEPWRRLLRRGNKEGVVLGKAPVRNFYWMGWLDFKLGRGGVRVREL